MKSVLSKSQAYHQRVIADANRQLLDANALLEVRVIAARRSGMSWQLIADAVGIARQSATERFEKLPELAVEEVR